MPEGPGTLYLSTWGGLRAISLPIPGYYDLSFCDGRRNRQISATAPESVILLVDKLVYERSWLIPRAWADKVYGLILDDPRVEVGCHHTPLEKCTEQAYADLLDKFDDL